MADKWLVTILSLFISLGAKHCANAQNSVTAWGNNSYKQCNLAIMLGSNQPVSISAGGVHSLAVKSDGTVSACGNDRYGQCSGITNLSGVASVTAGDAFSVALKNDGTVVVWGANDVGQTVVPSGLSDVTAVVAGYYHALALRSDGTVIAWGDNRLGQTNVPASLKYVTRIASSTMASHSLALQIDGTVVAWGNNSQGQCNVPQGLTNVVAIAAGGLHSLAVRADGTVVAWGYNGNGQCNVPNGLDGVVSVSAGFWDNYAVRSDGTMIVWGNDAGGNPCIAPDLQYPVVSVSVGGNHTVVMLNQSGTLPPRAVSVTPSVSTVEAGSAASLSVNAVGSGPLYYQWYRGSSIIDDATNSVLIIPGIRSDQSGVYTAVVANSAGLAGSSAMLNVIERSLSVRMIPAVCVSNLCGMSVSIQYIDSLGTTNWQNLATVLVTNDLQYIPDPSAVGRQSRFYRYLIMH